MRACAQDGGDAGASDEDATGELEEEEEGEEEEEEVEEEEEEEEKEEEEGGAAVAAAHGAHYETQFARRAQLRCRAPATVPNLFASCFLSQCAAILLGSSVGGSTCRRECGAQLCCWR